MNGAQYSRDAGLSTVAPCETANRPVAGSLSLVGGTMDWAVKLTNLTFGGAVQIRPSDIGTVCRHFTGDGVQMAPKGVRAVKSREPSHQNPAILVTYGVAPYGLRSQGNPIPVMGVGGSYSPNVHHRSDRSTGGLWT